MVIWMANWIRLPAKQSNSTCWSALNVIKLTKSMARWFVRLATQLLITRRPRSYVSEFNRRCETRSPNCPRAMSRKILNRCSQEESHGHGPFFGRHPRSEEHTSELQSQSNLVCRLLLEKKKK